MVDESITGYRALVVIPCLNEAPYLGDVVTGLIQRHASTLRIVIADGGSTDGSVAIGQKLAAAFSNVSLLENAKRIQSAGINRAVQVFGTQAEFVIRMDAHSAYPNDYCDVLIDEARRTHASSVVVIMNTVGKGWFQSAVAHAQNSKLGNGGAAHRGISKEGRWTDHGHHALMRIDAFLRVGGYDESFSHNEDAELDFRLRQDGFTIWLTGRTSVSYYPRSSAASLFNQYVNFGAGRARTLIKHRAMPRIRQVLPACVLPFFLLAFFAPISRTAATPFVLWALICLCYGTYLGIRGGSLSAAASGPAAMIMHFGWSVGFWKTLLQKPFFPTNSDRR